MSLKVNGQVIPPDAVEYELGRLIRFYSEHMSEKEIRNQLPALREKAREQAVGAKLLLDESRRLDIRVPEADIQAKLDEMVTQCGGREAFEKLLKEQHVSEETIRGGIAQGRRVDLLIERINHGVSDPTEAEMQAHFEAHREEYARPERAAASHILIKFEAGNAAQRTQAEARITSIRAAIEQGADFAEQAGQHSDCPSGAQAGGSLGWFSRGMMVPEFERAAFAMEVGQLSAVLETQFGFHIIRKTGQDAGGPADYDDVREKVREFLRHVARGETVAAYVADLRSKAVVEMG